MRAYYCFFVVLFAAVLSVGPAFSEDTVPVRPKVPGVLSMNLRIQVKAGKGSEEYKQQIKTVKWNASETAIIICDMWDNHYCQLAAQRVDTMAPKMNRVVTAARNHGVAIIHSPSGTMNVYENSPYRNRMKQAPESKPAVPLKGWCYLDPKIEPELPVDTSTQPCDDPVVGKAVRRFSKQHAGIKIIGYDGITDRGNEMYNYLTQLGIKNIVLMGVHTNMCVLGRPFGIRQLTYLDFNVVLARDLTDAMYDPREYPYVSHTRGTELVVEHIEKYWCPSISGSDLTKIIAGSNNPLAGTKRPDVKASANK
jgi:nicotinamidase-related amidase